MGRFCVSCVVLGLFAVVVSASGGGEEKLVKIAAQWKERDSGFPEPRGKQMVIRNAAEWQQTWKAAHAKTFPPPPVPKVNFTKHMVLAAYAGVERTGGYTIEFTQVKIVDGTLKAYVLEETPGPGPTISVITSPASFAVVPRSDLNVEFVIRRQELSASV